MIQVRINYKGEDCGPYQFSWLPPVGSVIHLKDGYVEVVKCSFAQTEDSCDMSPNRTFQPVLEVGERYYEN